MGSQTMTIAAMQAGGGMNRNPMEWSVIRKTIFDQVFAHIPAKGIDGTQVQWRRRGTTPSPVRAHNVGSVICEGTATSTLATADCGRILAQPSLDLYVAATSNLADPWIEQFEAFGPEVRDKIRNQVINGNGSFPNMNGLKTILAGSAYSAQHYRASTTTGGVQLQLHHLDKILKLVRGDKRFLLVDEDIYIDLKVLAIAAGGTTWHDMTMEFAGANGQVEKRTIWTYDGVPVFRSSELGTETTNGGSGKHRIIAGSFDEDGIEMFYPKIVGGRPTVMGLQIEPPARKQDYHEKYFTIAWYLGLRAKSFQCLADGINFKKTNA